MIKRFRFYDKDGHIDGEIYKCNNEFRVHYPRFEFLRCCSRCELISLFGIKLFLFQHGGKEELDKFMEWLYKDESDRKGE